MFSIARARGRLGCRLSVLLALSVLLVESTYSGERAVRPLDQPVGQWVKRSPLPSGPPSPRLGYEGACVWDSWRHVMIRYGGHNQGGGGEQGSEIWTFDPVTARWALMAPNTAPPGICCGQQNVFNPLDGRYIRFPAFSGSHGWQWFREIYLNDASVWTYDLAANLWRNMRPLPAPHVRPLRCASWDAEHQVVVMFGGEGSREGTVVYDPYENTWTWMRPERQPPFRSAGNMAYDAARGVHVLFGAQFSDDPHTWLYDLRRNAWTARRPDPSPPTDRNDAVLCYDTWARRILAVVKITRGEGEEAAHELQTWAYDAARDAWTRLQPPREPDPSGNRARQLMFAPELNAALLENRTRRTEQREPEQQIWTFRLTDQLPADPIFPPSGVEARTSRSAATLVWRPLDDPRIAGYRVYRGAGGPLWRAAFELVAELPADATQYVDRSVSPKTSYAYFVRPVLQDGALGPASVKARTRPPIVDNLVVSVVALDRVELTWRAPNRDDVAGYLVERAPVEVWSEDQLVRLKSQTPPLAEPSVGAIRRVGPFQALTKSPIRDTSFVDTKVDLRQPVPAGDSPVYESPLSDEHVDPAGQPYRYAVYAYRVRAVSALGDASGPSPAVLTIPSAPQWVFSQEAGAACRLKWRANPERGVRGYRVYRMDGRFRTAPIRRLTAEPVAATQWTDAEAGERTRRYYIVAVDALGQEGHPSAPVWHYREWRRFYEPFVGPWHQ